MLCRDGRYSYRCPACRFTFLSEYKIARREKSKEGLVHAMRHLGMNHAAAARWLLTNAEIPSSPVFIFEK